MSLTNLRSLRSWLKSTGFTVTVAAYSSVAFAWQDGLILPEQQTVPPTTEITITSDDTKTTSILEQSVVADPIEQLPGVEEVEGATPLMQGPIHEAFAERFDLDDEDALVIDREPPQPIDEQPPEYRPDGDNIEWIPGYWGWDIANDDFIWVSGVWRQVPPGQQWIPGYWTQTDAGWRWVSGFWTTIANPQIVYLPAPPESIDNGPSSPAPGANYFWIPGYWIYGSTGNYLWHSGHWHPCQTNWVWIPARYVWTPSGYVYRAGYWDYGVGNRGMLFAPIAFQPGFNRVYRPTYVIETSPLLFANLYIAPGTSYYYFGSCYAHSQRRCYPWVSYYNHGYDPLFSYYAYQSNQRVWLRNVTSLQSQFAAGPQSQQRWTVADQMNYHHHHGGNHGINAGINPGVNPGANVVINQGNNPNLGLNAMMHVAPLAALALASNNQKVDFKTPFAVKQASVQNNLVNSQQLNELAKKRRDLEKSSLAATSSGLPGSNSLPGSGILGAGNPVGGNPGSGLPGQVGQTGQHLKQIELIKPSKNGSGVPIDLKVGAGISPKAFSQSLGVQPSSGAATGTSNPGSSILSNNTPIGNNVGGKLNNPANNNPANGAANASGRGKRNHQAQQFSQLLGGSTSPVDPKNLESLRNQAIGSLTNNGVNGSTPGTSTGSTSGGTVTNKIAPPNLPSLNANNKGVSGGTSGNSGNPLINQLGGPQNNPSGNSGINNGGRLGNNTILGGKNGNGSGTTPGSGNGNPGLGGTILGGNKPNNPSTPATTPGSLPGSNPGSVPGTVPGASGSGSTTGGKPNTGTPGSGTVLGGGNVLGGNRSGGNKTGSGGSGGPGLSSGGSGTGTSGSGLGGNIGGGNILGGNRPGNSGTSGGGLGGNIGGGGRPGGSNPSSGTGGGGSTSGGLRSGGNRPGNTGTNGSSNSGNKNGGKKPGE